MAEFINELHERYGPEVTERLSGNFIADQGTVQKLVPQQAPLIHEGLIGSLPGGLTQRGQILAP